MEDSADESGIFGILILVLIILAIVYWNVTLIILGVGVGLFVLGLMILGIIMVFAAKKERIEKEESEKLARLQHIRAEKAARQAEEVARLERYKKTQQGYRQQMVILGEQSMSLFESIPQYLRGTEAHLDQADLDFAEGVFAPFWDSIEVAVNTLGVFDKNVCQIKTDLSCYTKLIEKYEDVPPEYPLSRQSIDKLAVGTATAERMKSIVRKAQSKFEFAMIYEQRKTNQILVAEFTNLGQALNGMTSRIASSIYNLASSIDAMRLEQSESLQAIQSKMDETAITTIQHHEEIVTMTAQHNEQLSRETSKGAQREEKVVQMLDNIQRKRKPFAWDAEHPYSGSYLSTRQLSEICYTYYRDQRDRNFHLLSSV